MTMTDPIHTLRRCAWKGNRRGLRDAIDELRGDDPFEQLTDAWHQLTDAYDAWDDDKNEDTAEELDQAVNAFDDACEPLWGQTEWQAEAESPEGPPPSPMREQMDVLVTGDPFTGLSIEGPYPAATLADYVTTSEPWWVVTLDPPTIVGALEE